jgi:hypothetical protein
MLALSGSIEELTGQPETIGERRMGVRVRQVRPVKVYEPLSGRFYAGQTRDISSGGLRLDLPASMLLVVGRDICVHVAAAAHGQPLVNRRRMVSARIVWLKRDPAQPGQLMAGIAFQPGIAAHLDAA